MYPGFRLRSQRGVQHQQPSLLLHAPSTRRLLRFHSFEPVELGAPCERRHGRLLSFQSVGLCRQRCMVEWQCLCTHRMSIRWDQLPNGRLHQSSQLDMYGRHRRKSAGQPGGIHAAIERHRLLRHFDHQWRQYRDGVWTDRGTDSKWRRGVLVPNSRTRMQLRPGAIHRECSAPVRGSSDRLYCRADAGPGRVRGWQRQPARGAGAYRMPLVRRPAGCGVFMCGFFRRAQRRVFQNLLIGFAMPERSALHARRRRKLVLPVLSPGRLSDRAILRNSTGAGPGQFR